MTVIRDKNANIFRLDVDMIVNPVNCVGVMGAGLAKAFSEHFPAMVPKYKQDCKRGILAIGEPTVYDRGSDETPRYVVNFPTKHHWRNASDIAWIQCGLVGLREIINDRGVDSVAIPALGCGLGGLDVEQVYDAVRAWLLCDNDVDVLFIG
jgi:O-acetyl-ADP-ribose deacetylase (regulator of RNase III)